jgi:hypothetical protein
MGTENYEVTQCNLCPSRYTSHIREQSVTHGRAIAQAVSRRLPTAAAFCDGQKWRWGRFSPRSSVSPANLHSICFFTIIFTITRGWHNRPHKAKKSVTHTPMHSARVSVTSTLFRRYPLRHIRYIRRFRKSLCFRLQVIGCHYAG